MLTLYDVSCPQCGSLNCVRILAQEGLGYEHKRCHCTQCDTRYYPRKKKPPFQGAQTN